MSKLKISGSQVSHCQRRVMNVERETLEGTLQFLCWNWVNGWELVILKHIDRYRNKYMYMSVITLMFFFCVLDDKQMQAQMYRYSGIG